MDFIDKLLNGFHGYKSTYFASHREMYRNLVTQGQHPGALVISCCDSRVDPAFITSCDPGDLFVIRNVANLVPPYEESGAFHGTSAAIEFGVCSLEISNIIIIGHEHCGGIRALMENSIHHVCTEGESFIKPWVDIAQKARIRVMEKASVHDDENARLRMCEQEALLVSLQNLMTFPWIRQRVAAGKLSIHGWYFSIESGELLAYNQNSGQFESQ